MSFGFTKGIDISSFTKQVDAFDFDLDIDIDREIDLSFDTNIDIDTEVCTRGLDFGNYTVSSGNGWSPGGVSLGVYAFASGPNASVSGSLSAGVSATGETFSSVSVDAFGEDTFVTTFEFFF